MKKLLCFVLFLNVNFFIFSQSPDSFTYQAVVRDGSGSVILNQPVGVQITVLQGSLPGTPVYIETHLPSTNGFGLINLIVGSGSVQSGNLSNVDWSAGPFYMNVSIDISGGTSYTDMGTVQLLSVPFALYAKTSGNGFSGNYNDLSNKPVLAGDVTGQTDVNTVVKIQGKDISTNFPANGQVLKWNNSTQVWEPSDDQLGAAGTTDGVVTGASISGTTTKTLTLIRSNGLGDITATFTDLTDDADADPTNEIQNLSLSGSSLSISGGNTITIPQNSYSAGTGIDITTGTISNIAPDQTVTMTSGAGINVTGTYPDFTIANTQPDQTVAITGSGATTVTGTYPNFNISSTDNNTTYSAGTGLSLTGTQFTHNAHSGDATGTTALTVTGIQGRQVTPNAPANGQVLKWNSTNSRWELADDELGAAGTNDGVVTSVGVTGTTTKTITLTRSQSLPDLTATFTDEGSVYSAGSGIGIAGNIISNTSPDQTVTIAGAGSTTVTGTYPNFTVGSTDNNTTYTAGTGLTLTGTQFSHNTHSGDVTGTSSLTVTGLRGITISSTVPTSGQVLKYNGTNWIASSDNNSGGTVTSIATNDGITGGTITNSGTIGLTGQALALHNLSTNGIIARTVSGTVAARTITGSTGISVTNGNGVSGNPTISPVFGTTAGTISEGSHLHTAYGAAGTNGEVQYNDNGNFGATSNFFWDNPNIRLGVGTNTPTAMMEVKQTTTMPVNGALFEVKNRLGQTVFVVYEDSVRIYVGDDGTKTSKGAFAVSGRNTAKQVTHDFFKVTPDSVRVYLDSTSSKGGFAVKSFGLGKKKDYMSVYVDTSEVLNPSVSRVLWYPSKEAFLSGRVLIQDPDSVGINSWATGYESKSIGNYSQALGYKARAKGNSSTAIGRHAMAIAPNSFAFGDSALAVGVGSFALGSVGRDTTGQPTNIPTRAFGNYSFSIGLGTRTDSTNAFAFGNNTWARGVSSTAFGYESVATGRYSIAGGFRCGALGRSAIAFGEETYAGKNAVALGIHQYAPSENAIAIGQFNFAESNGAVAIGYQNDLQGSTYAFGDNNYSQNGIWGSYSVGSSNIIRNNHDITLGSYNEATGEYCIALGNNLLSSGTGSLALGNYNEASGLYSISMGVGIETSGQYSFGIALNDQTGTVISQNNTMAIMGGNVGIGTVAPSYNLDVTGNIRATGAVYANANGTMYLKGGDDSEVWDVNQANTLAIYGSQNPAIATLRLGSGISEISGSNGNIGIGTNAPNVKLDVNGGIAVRQTTLASISSTQSNYNIGSGSYFRISSTATYAITGITGGYDGKIIILTNVGTNTINFNNEGLTSSAANRLANSTGAQIALAPGGTITYIYDAVSQRWRDIALR